MGLRTVQEEVEYRFQLHCSNFEAEQANQRIRGVFISSLEGNLEALVNDEEKQKWSEIRWARRLWIHWDWWATISWWLKTRNWGQVAYYTLILLWITWFKHDWSRKVNYRLDARESKRSSSSKENWLLKMPQRLVKEWDPCKIILRICLRILWTKNEILPANHQRDWR